MCACAFSFSLPALLLFPDVWTLDMRMKRYMPHQILKEKSNHLTCQLSCRPTTGAAPPSENEEEHAKKA